MFSTSLALLAQEFHGRERGTAFGAWGATIAASAAVGPLLGGALTQAFGWSSIFFINVPVGLAAVGLTLAKVNESRNPEETRLDWLGTVTFTASLFLLVFAVIRTSEKGWGNTEVLVLLAASAVAARPVHRLAVRAEQRDVRRVAVPQADVHRRVGGGVHACRRECSPCSCT